MWECYLARTVVGNFSLIFMKVIVSEILDFNMGEAKLRLTGSKEAGGRLVAWEETRVEKWKAKGRAWGGGGCRNMRKKREV